MQVEQEGVLGEIGKYLTENNHQAMSVRMLPLAWW